MTSDFSERSALLIALVLLVHPGCPVRAQDVYKSIDAQGHTVYSDRASTSTAQKSVVHVDQPDPAEVARIAKEQEILKAQDVQRKQQQSVDDKKKAQQDHDRQTRCDAARNRYYAVKDARRIFERDADGNRVYYTDPQADAQREEARQSMTAACGT
jgi:preprotein translocase subunit SecF